MAPPNPKQLSSEPVALVTGSSRGIGRHLAERLVAAGYRVAGCSREDPEWTIEGYRHWRTDVTDEAQVAKMFRQIRGEFGRLDVAVSNAGIASMNHALLMPATTATRIMNVNFIGSFLVCREAAKLMRRRNFGRIVNLSTIAVPLRLEGEAVYAASKSAVETMTRILGKELGPFGITVNAVGPTPIPTDLIRSVPEESIRRIVDHLSIKRLGTFDDVWKVVEFFIHPQSDYITGQVIYLGGV
jgi:3-oxoacyl-[acyl-carrier protein] reductase